MDKVKIECYVDGACSGNPGPAGIACISKGMIEARDNLNYTAYIGHATNNIAELKAIEACLQILVFHGHNDQNITIYTDSMYSIGVLTLNWKIKANVDLINKIKIVMRSFLDLHFVKVAGHTGDPDNERVNRMAQEISKLNKGQKK